MVSSPFLFLRTSSCAPEANAGGGQVSPGICFYVSMRTHILFPSGEEPCFLAQPTLEFSDSPASASTRPSFCAFSCLVLYDTEQLRPARNSGTGLKACDLGDRSQWNRISRSSLAIEQGRASYVRPRLWGDLILEEDASAPT